MPEHNSSPRPLSRRSVLRGASVAALAAAAAADPLLASCSEGQPAVAPPSSPSGTSSSPAGSATATAAGRPTNIRVSNDHYGVHIEPSLTANPRNPSHLLAACQAAPGADPTLIATYLSFDAGATWQAGGLPPRPSAAPDGDDITAAFDAGGRVYLCATRAGHADNPDPAHLDANRAVYVWRSDDGGRSFAQPVTLIEGEYCDHPWLTTGPGRTSTEQNVYVAWGAGTTHTALDLVRSTDGGRTFAAPRRILPEATTRSLVAAGPALAAGPGGQVYAVCDWTASPVASGDIVGQVTVVCSADGGDSFAAPVHLGAEASVIALPGKVMANSTPAVACSPRGDTVFVGFTRHEAEASHSDIMVTASRDRGRTWSAPESATPADDRIYFQPNLVVDDAGRLAVSAFALTGGHLSEVLLLSEPDKLRFRTPIEVTTAPFDPHSPTPSSGKHGAWWVGGYQGIAASAGAFHLVWNDTRTGRLELFAANVRP